MRHRSHECDRRASFGAKVAVGSRTHGEIDTLAAEISGSGDEAQTAEGRQVLGRHMFSIYHISEQTVLISIMHGDADPVVSLFQSQSFRKLAESKGVPIELVIKEGGNHGWPNRIADEVQFVKWFDQHLLSKATPGGERAGQCGRSVSAGHLRLVCRVAR